MATHFTSLEREHLSAWLQMKVSKAEIARRLGRDESTIFRELKRNSAKRCYGYRPSYSAMAAQQLSEQRKHAGPDRCACGMTFRTKRTAESLLRPFTSGLPTTITPAEFGLFCGVFA